jgi:hypothetical protein
MVPLDMVDQFSGLPVFFRAFREFAFIGLSFCVSHIMLFEILGERESFVAEPANVGFDFRVKLRVALETVLGVESFFALETHKFRGKSGLGSLTLSFGFALGHLI